MARRRFARSGKPTVQGMAIVRLIDEEKARHPDRTIAEIAHDLGIRQKDPARLVRRLRSGETSGVDIWREITGKKPPRKPPKKPAAPAPPITGGRFIVLYHWWYTALPEVKYQAATHILIDVSPVLVFRLAVDPRVIDAVEKDLARRAARNQRSRDGSIPTPDRGEYDFEIDRVYPERYVYHTKFPALIIPGNIVA